MTGHWSGPIVFGLSSIIWWLVINNTDFVANSSMVATSDDSNDDDFDNNDNNNMYNNYRTILLTGIKVMAVFDSVCLIVLVYLCATRHRQLYRRRRYDDQWTDNQQQKHWYDRYYQNWQFVWRSPKTVNTIADQNDSQLSSSRSVG
ncbi:uncharacterized protein LOC128954918 [Oppia nitens]|uniref:uncharacterized protein LOC128954918 n=1 Tax=Oppia nitens TaxID=1686743 RepID=UPI0023D99501|nr:uncharacterized protein LOC128954918 [Oppia nitens]